MKNGVGDIHGYLLDPEDKPSDMFCQVYKSPIGIEWTWPLIAGLGVSGFCLSFGCVAIEVWRKNSRGS